MAVQETSCRPSTTAGGAPSTTESAYLQRQHQQTYQHQHQPQQQTVTEPAAGVSWSPPDADSCRHWGHLPAAVAEVTTAPQRPAYAHPTNPHATQLPAHAPGAAPGHYCRASWSGAVSQPALAPEPRPAPAGPTAGRVSCPDFREPSQPATAQPGLQAAAGATGTGVAGEDPGALPPGLCTAPPVNAPRPSMLYLSSAATPTEPMSLSPPPPSSGVEATTPTCPFSRPPGPPPGYPNVRQCDERLFVRKKSSKKDLHKYVVRMYHTWTYGEEEEGGSGPGGSSGGGGSGGGSSQDMTLVRYAAELPPTLTHGSADGSFSSSTGAAAPPVLGSPTGRVASNTSCNAATATTTAAAAAGDANPSIAVQLARGPSPVTQGCFLARFLSGIADVPSSGFVNGPAPRLPHSSADPPPSGAPRAPTSRPCAPGAFGIPAAGLPSNDGGCGGGTSATVDARGHGGGLRGPAEGGSAAQGWSGGQAATPPAGRDVCGFAMPTATPMDEQPMTSRAPSLTGHIATAPAAAAAFAAHPPGGAFGHQQSRPSGSGPGIEVSPFGHVAPPSPVFPSSPDTRASPGGHTGGGCLLPAIPFQLRTVRTAAPTGAHAVAFTAPTPHRRQFSDAGYTCAANSAAGHAGPSATGGVFDSRSPGALDARGSCSHLHPTGSPAGDASSPRVAAAADTACWSPFGAVTSPLGLAAATAGVAAVSVESTPSTPNSHETTPPPPPPPSETQYGIGTAAGGGCSGLPAWWPVDSGQRTSWQVPVDGMGPSPAVMEIGRTSRPPVTTGAVVTRGIHPAAPQPPPLLPPTWSPTVPVGRSGGTAPEAQGGAAPAATPSRSHYRGVSEA